MKRTTDPRYLIISTFTFLLMALVLAWPVQAQEPVTNAAHGVLSYTGADGKTITVPVSGWVETALGFVVLMFTSFLGKLALQFLPAAKEPGAYATFLAGLKRVSVTTPVKHVEASLAASPNNNITLTPGVGASATEIKPTGD